MQFITRTPPVGDDFSDRTRGLNWAIVKSPAFVLLPLPRLEGVAIRAAMHEQKVTITRRFRRVNSAIKRQAMRRRFRLPSVKGHGVKIPGWKSPHRSPSCVIFNDKCISLMEALMPPSRQARYPETLEPAGNVHHGVGG